MIGEEGLREPRDPETGATPGDSAVDEPPAASSRPPAGGTAPSQPPSCPAAPVPPAGAAAAGERRQDRWLALRMRGRGLAVGLAATAFVAVALLRGGDDDGSTAETVAQGGSRKQTSLVAPRQSRRSDPGSERARGSARQSAAPPERRNVGRGAPDAARDDERPAEEVDLSPTPAPPEAPPVPSDVPPAPAPAGGASPEPDPGGSPAPAPEPCNPYDPTCAAGG